MTSVSVQTGGRVLWITGLSGAGKTTVAREVVATLRARGTACIHLDGDEMREALSDPGYGFDRESRLRGAGIYARLADLCARQGLFVVVSTISLFHEIHAWNRAHLPGYFEVFLDVPESVRRERDPKGLYRGMDRGSNASMGGVDLALEIPLEPHLRIVNDGGNDDVPRVARMILQGAGAVGSAPADSTGRED